MKSIRFYLYLEYIFKPGLLAYFEDKNAAESQLRDWYKYEYLLHVNFLGFWERAFPFPDKYLKLALCYQLYDKGRKFISGENNL